MQPIGGQGHRDFDMIVITSCTSRKRGAVVPPLHAATLPRASAQEVIAEWCRRLSAQEARVPATQLYAGRGFREAVCAAHQLNANLFVASAGLGLIRAETPVPPYACTILAGAPDSIADRIGVTFSARAWWRQISGTSPFSVAWADVAVRGDRLICAALSESYVAMVEDDLISLDAQTRSRLRLFTGAPVERIAPALRAFVMPYDARLDGPDSVLRGTRSDFSSRALRHFVEAVLRPGDRRSADKHAEAVREAIRHWKAPARIVRTRHDDEALRALLHRHWDAAGGSSARLLRLFRDQLQIACEQGRFAALVREVRAERA